MPSNLQKVGKHAYRSSAATNNFTAPYDSVCFANVIPTTIIVFVAELLFDLIASVLLGSFYSRVLTKKRISADSKV